MRTTLIAFLLSASLVAAQTAAQKPAATATKKPSAGTAAPAAGNPRAIFDTTAGTLACDLFPKQAPQAVASFIGLANGTKDWTNPVSHMPKKGVPLYDGTIFHRVIPNFMIQGGDPAGDGTGEIGFRLQDELKPDLKFDRAGRLAYANSGPNTSGSQFFITEVPVPGLDACLDAKGCTRGGQPVPKGWGYTIFGQCDAATVEMVKKIARAPRDPRNDRPFKPVKINHITIEQPGASTAAKKPADKPAATTPTKK
ncbi:MAG: peptidylprolyl isomerase [Acidobacteriia bacterium]|nr:peptidylprolyl isomerase [Terriglobia bacterium]